MRSTHAKIELKVTEVTGRVTTVTCFGVVEQSHEEEPVYDCVGREMFVDKRYQFIVHPRTQPDGTTYRMEVVE